MRVLAAFGQGLLENAAESEFFADGGYQCNDQQIDEKTAKCLNIEHPFSECRGGIFHAFQQLFNLCEGITEVHAFVPLGEQVGDGQRDEHQSQSGKESPNRVDFPETDFLQGLFSCEKVKPDRRNGEHHDVADALCCLEEVDVVAYGHEKADGASQQSANEEQHDVDEEPKSRGLAQLV